MPEPTEQTQNSPAAGTAPASSEGAANNQAGPSQVEGEPAAQVENGTAPQGNSGSSDGGNGTSEVDEGRARPPRSERRISELSKVAADEKKRADDTEAENKRLRELLGNPIDQAKINLQLPDYSQQDSVRPEQIAADVRKAAIDAADQIVKIRLGQLLPEAMAGQDIKRSREAAVGQLREVSNSNSRYYHPELDPDNEAYEPDTDDFLAKTFTRVFKADPTYNFRELVTAHFKQRGGRAQNNTNGENGTTGKPKTPVATRGTTGATSQPHKPIGEMSAAEYRDFLNSKK